MPLAMSREVFITCAVTGSGSSRGRSAEVPRAPAWPCSPAEGMARPAVGIGVACGEEMAPAPSRRDGMTPMPAFAARRDHARQTPDAAARKQVKPA